MWVKYEPGGENGETYEQVMTDGQTTDRLITKRLPYGIALINIQRIRSIQSFTCSTHVEKAKWCDNTSKGILPILLMLSA